MSCEAFVSRLDEHVDGTLEPSASAEVGNHLASCPRCRAEERAIQSLKDSAAALPEAIDPRRDLWEGIATRLGARKSFLRPALIAASMAAVLAGAGYLALIVPRGVPSSGAPAVVPATESFPAPASVPALHGADLAFLEARQQLRTALYERRKTFSPETVRKVDQNLQIIESAIEEIRTAVAHDPGNRKLQRMLISTRQREVALLRHVTQTANLQSR
jgi:hypothetical protein